MKKHELQYALSKQIPAARYNLNIQTDYGYLQLWDEDARVIAHQLEVLLEHKLKTGDYEEEET